MDPVPQARKLLAIAPIKIPLGVKQGVSDDDPNFKSLLQEICDNFPQIISQVDQSQEQEYAEIDRDTKSVKLFIWQPQNGIRFHVFRNFIAIAECEFSVSETDIPEDVEKKAQSDAKKIIEEQWLNFRQLVVAIEAKEKSKHQGQSGSLLDFDLSKNSCEVSWITRTVVLEKQDISNPQWRLFVSDWLKNTIKPEDAEKLINGDIQYSITWMNYVIVLDEQVPEKDSIDYRLDAMMVAQYYYTAQDHCNKRLHKAIHQAYININTKVAEHDLKLSRLSARMLAINYKESLKYFTRKKKNIVIDILNGWDYEDMVESGSKMIEVCSSRLEEVDRKRRERSSIVTDILLAAINFFLIFELCIVLIEYSREVMSRPALEFNDDRPSFLLRIIANIHTDYMLSFGLLFTIFMITLYIKDKWGRKHD